MSSPAPRSPETHQQKITRSYAFPQTGVAATGTVTADTNANMADGDKVVLSDGFVTKTYEYDKSANGVTAGNVTWTAGTTAASVATNLKTAILANQPAIAVSDNLAGVLTLTNRWSGSGGNVAATKTSASALAVTGMAGGVEPAGTTLADTTIKLGSVKGRAWRFKRVSLTLSANLAADATNFCTFKLVKNASTVIASWSTQTGAQGAITANTPVELVLGTGANIDLVDGDTYSLFLDCSASPSVPPGILAFEASEL